LMGATFPLGLMLVVLAGGELFTGNCAYFIPSVMNKEQAWKCAFRNWTLVWIGNFIGVLFFAYFLVSIPGLLQNDPWHTGIQKIAVAKISNPFLVTFLKGVGANWLVCLAMWLGMSAKETTGKIIGIWWAVMAFVTLGYEHCIANMFFIPMAMLEGADISVFDMFVKNLIPATLGNIVGGSFFVGGLYWYSYEKLGKGK
ncbi:MAG: formate/nitrite transporter family protein, partial [Phocaeicola sp.]